MSKYFYAINLAVLAFCFGISGVEGMIDYSNFLAWVLGVIGFFVFLINCTALKAKKAENIDAAVAHMSVMINNKDPEHQKKIVRQLRAGIFCKDLLFTYAFSIGLFAMWFSLGMYNQAAAVAFYLFSLLFVVDTGNKIYQNVLKAAEKRAE